MNHLAKLQPIAVPDSAPLAAPVKDNYRLGIETIPASQGPTILEMGDGLLARTDMNGLLTWWGTLLARKWTGYRPKTTKNPSHDPSIAIKLDIRSRAMVDLFMDKVQEKAQAFGIDASAILDNPKLYTESIATAREKLAKEEQETIAASLFEEVRKTASKTNQHNAFLAKVKEELPKLEQQFLSQASSLDPLRIG